jgi:superfamily II DNA or RNA helicase
MIEGPPMRALIKMGYLSDYRFIAVKNHINLSNIPLSASGDFSPPKLRSAVHESKIVGDIVQNYLKFAEGKLGITFAVDIEAATEIALAYKQAGIAAEVISSKTPTLLRSRIMNQFRRKEVMQLVNVDLLGEGVDVPAVEVVTMARPSCSKSLVWQQMGRCLRPSIGKTHGIIIDHVDNWIRHGLPDQLQVWSLDRRERRTKSNIDPIIHVKNCLNENCLAVYERVYKQCPFCGFSNPIQQRSSPAQVDGDLVELDPIVLAQLRGEVDRIDGPAHPPSNLDRIAQLSVIKRHNERQRMQQELREQIALYAGYYKALDCDDSEIYRRFYAHFGIDILTAQALNAKDADILKNKIIGILDEILLMG